jgi:hypothetical protein
VTGYMTQAEPYAVLGQKGPNGWIDWSVMC